MTFRDPESQNCFRFVLLLQVRFVQKVFECFLPFFSRWYRSGVYRWLLRNWIAIPQGTLPWKQIFVILGRFPPDCRIVADLLGICCTACRGVVVCIRFLADMLWTCLVIFCRHYDSRNRTNGIWALHASRCVPYTSGGLFDHQFAIHSWRRGRIVYDSVVDQIFTAWHYMLCIRAT